MRPLVSPPARVLAAAVTAVVAAPLFFAAPAFAASSAAQDSPFDTAQEALGLSADDAQRLAPGVRVTADDDSAKVSLGDVQVTVAGPEDKPADTTVLSDGIRLMSLLAEGETTATFELDLPKRVSLAPNGQGYDLVGDASGTRVILGHIAKPWAVDAQKNTIDTFYTLEGNTLTQHIDPAGAAYPVVVDPAITVGWGADGPGVYWNMYGYQAKALAAAVSTSLALIASGGCAAAGKVPRVGYIIAGLCGFIGLPRLRDVLANIRSIMSSTALDNSTCYQIKVPAAPRFRATSRSNCA